MKAEEFKVNFFCVGVAKAGTTTLHDLLALQRNISLPERKETNYFSFGISGKPAFTGPLDASSVNEPTIVTLDEYIADFNYEAGDFIGEICPSYMLEGAAGNIYLHNPEAKIIVLLREPVGRAISNYQHLVRDGREPLSFEEALGAESERLDQGWEWFWGLKKNSLYYDAVQEYVTTFGQDNVKIILFEDFVSNQRQYLEEILDFIGYGSADVIHKEVVSNKSGVVAERWRLLHGLLLSEGMLNSFLRKLLPTPVRKKLGQVLKTFTTEKGEIPVEIKDNLSRDFSDDLDRLNTLISGRIDRWIEGRDVS